MYLPSNAQDFILKEIPDLHPLSLDYKYFWKEQLRYCLEGKWEGGHYMPPSLYFYASFGTILRNTQPHLPKTPGRPTLRDLEWEFFYNYTEARGFSGFLDDPTHSSHKILLDTSLSDEYLSLYFPSTVTTDGTRKIYEPARQALRKHSPFPLGPALFENEVQNFMMLGSRETGKSYMVGSGLVPHNFLFDGRTRYVENDEIPRIEIIVGAEHSKRSKDLLDKTRLTFDNLPGAKQIGKIFYPSPFAKKIQGSWDSDIVAKYRRKEGTEWRSAGSLSAIKHRTFNSDPFAAQGTRPLLLVIEEAGLCSNLKEIYSNTVDNLRLGLRKTGMLMMLGTGGDMEKGTIHASEMFYEPHKYDILPFEDTHEHRGSIGFFIPAYYALNEFKRSDGSTDVEAAKSALLKVRDKKKGDSGGSDALNKEMQYRPLVPSEMFLSRTANIFPTAELRRRLSEIQTQKLYELNEKKVNLFFDPSSTFNGVSYQIDSSLKAISNFPYDGDDREGAVVIYEFPHTLDGQVPKDLYIIGCDPFKDDTPDGPSLASIYVMKTSSYFSTFGHNEIVASYVGRPYFGKNHVNEILHKLALLYNAKIYFENAVGNVKDYFEKINRLDLLASQPVTVFNRKASYNTSPSVVYGYPMSNDKIKWEALQYLRSWLLTERDQSKRNVDFLPDPALIQELIAFNMDGNFDRVMGLVGCIIGLEEIHNLSKRREEFQTKYSDLQKEFDSFVVNNRRLFRPSIS